MDSGLAPFGAPRNDDLMACNHENIFNTLTLCWHCKDLAWPGRLQSLL